MPQSRPQSIRFHTKTRSGCANCKKRRVKCDEGKPRCSSCSRRGADCVYGSGRQQDARSPASCPEQQVLGGTPTGPSSPLTSPPLPVASHYSEKNLLDLRLMHHYCVATAPGFASDFPEMVLRGLQIEAPVLACQHPFLMDAILLVSMVHLTCTRPTAIEGLPVYHYRDQALKALRYAVANISQDNIAAVRTASALLAQVSFATDRVTQQPNLWVANWLALAVGQRNFRGIPWTMHYPNGQEMYNFSAAEHRSPAEASAEMVMPTAIRRALAQPADDDGDESQSDLELAANELAKLIAVTQAEYETVELEKGAKAWAFDRLPAGFHRMVQRQSPKALVILAHYLTIVKLFPETWLYQDLVRHDIAEIEKSLGPSWLEYISVPKAIMHLQDVKAVIQSLRNSLEDKHETQYN